MLGQGSTYPYTMFGQLDSSLKLFLTNQMEEVRKVVLHKTELVNKFLVDL